MTRVGIVLALALPWQDEGPLSVTSNSKLLKRLGTPATGILESSSGLGISSSIGSRYDCLPALIRYLLDLTFLSSCS